jgi:hypothetical protein
MTSRRRGRRRLFIQNHHHVSAARAGLSRRLQDRLRGGRLRGRLSPLNGDGRDWRGRRNQFLRRSDNRRLLLSPRRRRLGAQGLGTKLRRYHPRAQRQALQRRQAGHAGVGMRTRRQKATSANKSSRKNHDKGDQKSEAYILERTRAFFTGLSNEPCSGAACFEPAGSGATHFGPAVLGDAPLRPAASTMATLSPARSGAGPPASMTAGVGPWPPRRGTHDRLGLCRPG